MAQLLRYALVGTVSNGSAYVAYLLLTAAGIGPRLAMTVVYVAAATAAFWGNRWLTFHHRGSVASSGSRFALAHLAGYATNLTLLTVFVRWLGLPHQLVQAIAIVLVAGLLFVLSRNFVFVDIIGKPGGQP